MQKLEHINKFNATIYEQMSETCTENVPKKHSK